MIDLTDAYNIGKKLALYKFAEKEDAPVAELTKVLDKLLDNKIVGGDTSVLDSAERSSAPTWGDKMELETSRNTGINL